MFKRTHAHTYMLVCMCLKKMKVTCHVKMIKGLGKLIWETAHTCNLWTLCILQPNYICRLEPYDHKYPLFNSPPPPPPPPPPPSDAYMRQQTRSALVQIMACRLFGAKPISSNMFQWNLNRDTAIFIERNAFQNVVCEMAAILPRVRWVKSNTGPRWQLPWNWSICLNCPEIKMLK